MIFMAIVDIEVPTPLLAITGTTPDAIAAGVRLMRTARTGRAALGDAAQRFFVSTEAASANDQKRCVVGG